MTRRITVAYSLDACVSNSQLSVHHDGSGAQIKAENCRMGEKFRWRDWITVSARRTK